MPLLSQLGTEAFRNVLENLPFAVYLVDPERRIIFWNDGCERITGHLRHEVIGRCCADHLLMHCDENVDALCGSACPLVDTMHDGRPREADIFLRHRHGQRIPVHVRAVPLRDEHGAIIGACECFEERALSAPEHSKLHLVELPVSVDEVTGVPDRHATLRRLQSELADYQASSLPFGVLCLAIDETDHLRAEDGGNAVKKVMHATAQTLSKCAGVGNFVGRWSDVHFLVIIRACSQEMLMDYAMRLKRLAALESVPWWGGQLTITLSAGGTMARKEDTAEDLARRGEEALNAGSGVNRAAVI